MRPVVNLDRCEGTAYCVNIAPNVFQLDDDDYAVVIADPVLADQEAPAARLPVLFLNAERVDGQRQQQVSADGERQIHALLLGEQLSQ